ncbi:uncharacterized protein Z518_11067 [Rhinocladiella mackenziei CBS 650.93]|uniref:Rhinocladiella mackenziei CBS 650.93 unplaced genomic scaffold supercont1.11, whole genome shotgun sequence n=1 Tax=Rhinocladiella mackenziei CBS 650.93 TaxID=1442369 RepID=A0A0D2ISC2_9EURO|nr:uncharacterized protein Z518_11067 [Rhinocladiella mackenziei CBS 650.93]KIW99654.1 hypothetical protein Z518_11067 [Rhinocladiella mackenziei CBS 650.93]
MASSATQPIPDCTTERLEGGTIQAMLAPWMMKYLDSDPGLKSSVGKTEGWLDCTDAFVISQHIALKVTATHGCSAINKEREADLNHLRDLVQRKCEEARARNDPEYYALKVLSSSYRKISLAFGDEYFTGTITNWSLPVKLDARPIQCTFIGPGGSRILALNDSSVEAGVLERSIAVPRDQYREGFW